MDEAEINCGVMALLGLLCGLPSGALCALQIGELCSAAVALVGGTVEEAAALLGRMGEQADQARLLGAVLACADGLTAVRASLLREAAETAVATVGFLGPPEGDLLPRGTAGVHAAHHAATTAAQMVWALATAQAPCLHVANQVR